MLKLSRQERELHFLQRARQKYGEQYDYSEVKYVNLQTQIKVKCFTHGIFHTSPKNFLSKTKKIGCPSCSRSQNLKLNPKKTTQYTETKGCGTNKFNVKGGTKKYQDLLLKVFE
ncbi:hypothetical protein ACIMS1_004502 [Vibrio harveyi]